MADATKKHGLGTLAVAQDYLLYTADKLEVMAQLCKELRETIIYNKEVDSTAALVEARKFANRVDELNDHYFTFLEPMRPEEEEEIQQQ